MSDLLKEFGIEPAQGMQATMVDPQPAPAEPQPVPSDAGGAPVAGPPAGPDLNAAVQATQDQLAQVGRVAKDVGIGLTEAIPAAGQGAAKAVNELLNSAFWLGKLADRYVPLGQIVFDEKMRPSWQPGQPEKNVAQLPEVFKPSSTTGGMVEGVSQFITSYAIGGKLLRMLGVAPAVTAGGKIAESAAQTFFAGSAGFDPAEARLSNLVEQYPTLSNPVTQFLATSPDDSEALGRFKNGLEQVLMNGPVDAVFYAVKGISAKRAGNLAAAEENAKLAEQSFQLWREQHADARGEVLDRGGSGLPAPAKVDVDALEAAQQGGMYGAPGTVVPEGQTLQGVEPKAPEAAPPEPPKFDQQNLLDTFRLARGDYGINLDTFSGSILGKNMSKVNNENDAKAFFNVLGTTEEAAFRAANGRPRTHAEIIEHSQKELAKLADYTGVDVRELTARMAADNETLDQLATRVAGYRMATEVYSKRSAELARMVIAGDASEFGGSLPALQAEFLKTTQTLLAIAPLTEGVKSGLGRNLSLLNATIGPGKEKIGSLAGIMDTGAKPPRPGEAPKLGPDGKPLPAEPTPAPMSPQDAALAGDLQKALEGDAAFVRRLAEKLQLVDNPKQAKKIVDDAFGPGLMDVNNEVWINGLLSGPKTHVVNMITSALKSAVVMPTEQLLAGVFRADTNVMRMAADQYVGMFLAMKDALRVTGTALKQSDAVLDPTHMALGGQGAQHALTPATLGLRLDTPIGRLVEGFGNLVRLPGRLLTTEDELLKQLNYRGRLYSLAMREGRAMMKAHPDMTPEKLGEFVAEYIERGFDEAGRGVNPEAMAYARDATFTNALKANTWRGTKTVGESINEMAINHPGLRVVLPFTRVPTNIMRDAWDHTPGMNILRKQYWEELTAGGERAAMARAKMATGGALWAAAIMMAINGDITGSLSSDPTIRKAEQDSKKVPNALRFYDEQGNPYYVEYGRLQPYSTFFSIAATMAETAGHVDEYKLEDLAGSLLTGLAKNIESQTYLQGLTNILSALADPDKRGAKALEKHLASYIPSVTNTFKGADYLLEPHGFVQSMQARTASGQTGAVDARYNLLGEKVEMPKAFGPQWLSPFTIGKPDDPVLTELARLMQVHKGGLSYPGTKVGNVDLTDLVMGDKSAHARLQELAGEVKVGGKNLRERLTEFFGSDQYKNVLKDGDATYDGGRMYQTQAIIQAHREAAKAALARENPEFRALWMADEQKKVQTIRFGKQ